MDNLSEKIDRAVRRIKSLGGDKIRFIILYGSACEGRMKEDSDIDICVYYDGADASEFRLSVLSDLFDDIYDIKIFQQLSLPLRMEVLKGRVLYADDTPFMYDKAYETIKEFESFKRRYYDYLGIESIA
ncbi:MAG: nucleotidyltransferase domain-containing protein [Methanothrix sp.]